MKKAKMLSSFLSACLVVGGCGGEASHSTSQSTGSFAPTIVSPPETTGVSSPPAAAAATPGYVPSSNTEGVVLRGINIGGGEFGRAMPGKLDTDYTYPTAAEIAGYKADGFTLIRVPVRWERLVYAPGDDFRENDLVKIDAVIDAALANGMVVVIDLHNYARWSDGPDLESALLIGKGNATTDDLLDFWIRIGNRYAGMPHVWMGIMNEPHNIEVEGWWQIAQYVVSGLRRSGINNKLLVPGGAWTGAHSWVESGNAKFAEQFADPADNFAFEVHQYLDPGSSGTIGSCEVGAASRIEAVLAWAEVTQSKIFVGEMAAGKSPQCAIEYPAMIRRLEQSPQLVGWAVWGGGSWFDPADPFALPIGAEEGQIEYLEPYLGV